MVSTFAKREAAILARQTPLRVLGKKWGYIVFAADIFKGWLSVTLAYAFANRFAPDQLVIAGVLAGLFSVLGHNFPIWLGFKGGKGIATSAGIMLALFPIWVFLCALVVWVSFFYTTRYVSVASIFAAISLSCFEHSFSRSLENVTGFWCLSPLLMTGSGGLATQVEHRTAFCGNGKKIRETTLFTRNLRLNSNAQEDQCDRCGKLGDGPGVAARRESRTGPSLGAQSFRRPGTCLASHE